MEVFEGFLSKAKSWFVAIVCGGEEVTFEVTVADICAEGTACEADVDDLSLIYRDEEG